VCSKVMPVKSIYLLNVVVKQKTLVKTGKQNRLRLAELSRLELRPAVVHIAMRR